MPSYVDALIPGDRAADERARWALAHYVRSLQLPVQRGGVLKVRRVAGELPTSPDDEAWQQAPELDVPLFGQVIFKPRLQTPSVDLVRVRVDGQVVADEVSGQFQQALLSSLEERGGRFHYRALMARPAEAERVRFLLQSVNGRQTSTTILLTQ